MVRTGNNNGTNHEMLKKHTASTLVRQITGLRLSQVDIEAQLLISGSPLRRKLLNKYIVAEILYIRVLEELWEDEFKKQQQNELDKVIFLERAQEKLDGHWTSIDETENQKLSSKEQELIAKYHEVMKQLMSLKIELNNLEIKLESLQSGLKDLRLVHNQKLAVQREEKATAIVGKFRELKIEMPDGSCLESLFSEDKLEEIKQLFVKPPSADKVLDTFNEIIDEYHEATGISKEEIIEMSGLKGSIEIVTNSGQKEIITDIHESLVALDDESRQDTVSKNSQLATAIEKVSAQVLIFNCVKEHENVKSEALPTDMFKRVAKVRQNVIDTLLKANPELTKFIEHEAKVQNTVENTKEKIADIESKVESLDINSELLMRTMKNMFDVAKKMPPSPPGFSVS